MSATSFQRRRREQAAREAEAKAKAEEQAKANPFTGAPDEAEVFVQKASVKDILAALDATEAEARPNFAAFVLGLEQQRDEPRSTLIKALEPQANLDEESDEESKSDNDEPSDKE